MRIVGLKVLKNKLSEYVRIAAAGEPVLISDRDRVVAEIVPPRGTRADRVADATLADLVRNGVLVPRALATGAPPRARPVASLRSVLSDLDRDRGDR